MTSRTSKLTDVSGIGPASAKLLETHGFKTVKSLAEAAIEQLVEVPGFGADRAGAIKEAAMRLLVHDGLEDDAPGKAPAVSGEPQTPDKKTKKDKKKSKKDKKKDKKKSKKNKKKDKGGKGKSKKDKSEKGKSK